MFETPRAQVGTLSFVMENSSLGGDLGGRTVRCLLLDLRFHSSFVRNVLDAKEMKLGVWYIQKPYICHWTCR
jgi:hypothetical protein